MMKMLIVEENSMKTATIDGYLKSIDPKVNTHEVISLVDFIAEIRSFEHSKNPYDLIILDPCIPYHPYGEIQMDHPDGEKILSILEEMNLLIPVVICSNSYELKRARRNVCGFINYNRNVNQLELFQKYYNLAKMVKNLNVEVNNLRKKSFAGWNLDRIILNKDAVKKITEETPESSEK